MQIVDHWIIQASKLVDKFDNVIGNFGSLVLFMGCLIYWMVTCN